MDASIAWEDLALVLAVSRTGTLAAAADRLGVHHSTAFRRLARAEAHAGVALFHRENGRYLPTETGAIIAEHAARVEDELLGVDRAIASRERVPRGRVRLTTVPSLVPVILPALSRLTAQCPELHVELDPSPDPRTLERGEADIALRPTANPPPGLVGSRLTPMAWASYRARRSPDVDAWIGYVGRLAELDDPAPSSPAASLRVTTVMAMAESIAAGFGRGRLPVYLGDADPRLQREGEVVLTRTELWLLVPEALRHSARIQATRERLMECLRPELARFTGAGAEESRGPRGRRTRAPAGPGI